MRGTLAIALSLAHCGLSGRDDDSEETQSAMQQCI